MYFEINPRAIALLDESISALLPDDYAVAADTPYGGAPGRPLTPEEIERLKGPKERTPPPPGFREQYLPKDDNTSFLIDQFLAENQGPSTPVKYYPDANKGLGGYLPNRGAGYPANVRPKGQQFFI